jgi:hypothetical protein
MTSESQRSRRRGNSLWRLFERLPVVTLAMSLPLFFSVQLKNPPEFLHGPLLIATWTWAVVAVVTLPVLVAAELALCWWLWSRAGTRSLLGWHGRALVVAIWAELVFMVARGSG